jgi:hypothetical protein
VLPQAWRPQMQPAHGPRSRRQISQRCPRVPSAPMSNSARRCAR